MFAGHLFRHAARKRRYFAREKQSLVITLPYRDELPTFPHLTNLYFNYYHYARRAGQ